MTPEEIQQIREEQQLQYNAPSKPIKKVLQAISNVYHPLLMLTYAALMLCAFTGLTVLPMAIKAYFVGKVFFYTTLLPVLALTLLHMFHIVGHWALRDRRDRALPLFINMVCYGLNAYSLRSDGFFPDWMLRFFYAAVVVSAIAWIVSLWWKISAHASGNAAFATMSMILYFYFPENMPLWFCLLAIVMTGLVSSIRIYLGRHTLSQIGWGVLAGVVCMSGAMQG